MIIALAIHDGKDQCRGFIMRDVRCFDTHPAGDQDFCKAAKAKAEVPGDNEKRVCRTILIMRLLMLANKC